MHINCVWIMSQGSESDRLSAQGSRFRRTMGPFRSSCPGLVGALGIPNIQSRWNWKWVVYSVFMPFIVYDIDYIIIYYMQIFVYDMEWTIHMEGNIHLHHVWRSSRFFLLRLYQMSLLNITVNRSRTRSSAIDSVRLGGGNSNIFFMFTLKIGGRWFSVWLIIFRCVGSTT